MILLAIHPSIFGTTYLVERKSGTISIIPQFHGRLGANSRVLQFNRTSKGC